MMYTKMLLLYDLVNNEEELNTSNLQINVIQNFSCKTLISFRTYHSCYIIAILNTLVMPKIDIGKNVAAYFAVRNEPGVLNFGSRLFAVM